MADMLELLSITDAAVKALNKSSRSQSPASSRSSKSSTSNSKRKTRSDGHDSGICPTESRGALSHIDQLTEGQCQGHLNRSSDESTTASDVLIRSTLADPEDQTFPEDKSFQSVHVEDESAISKYSKSSVGMDNFNSSGPQKVKISSKKLREIKSPYESPRDEPQKPIPSKGVPNGKPLVSNKQDNRTTYNEPKIRNGQVQQPMLQKSSAKVVKSQNIVKKPISNNPKEIVTLQSTPQGKKTTKRIHTPPQRDVQPGWGTPPSYESSNEDVRPPLIERHTPPKQTKTRVTPSDMNGSYIDSPQEKNLDGSLDLIPSKPDIAEHGNDSRSTEPEIVTVPEKIVEVSARNSVSEDSTLSEAHSEKIVTIPERIVTISARTSVSDENSINKEDDDEDEKIPPRLMDKFLTADNKAHTTGLRQGAPVSGVTDPDRKSNSDDICVSKFTLTDKEKLIKESFARRYEQSGPKKRVVQPVLIGQKKNEGTKTAATGGAAPGNQTTEAVTAAVAASAAIAATQPFLKAQRELESTMAQILDKIAVLQNGTAAQRPGPGRDSTESHKVMQLEQQVAELTEQRIKHLETLQEHQTVLQAKLLSFSRTPDARSKFVHDSQSHLDTSRSRSPTIRSPSRSPPVHRKFEAPRKAFSKTTVTDKLESRPNYDGQRQKYVSTSDKLPQSPLGTPNPRSRAPKPVAFDTSDVKTASKVNKNRGILEEILASDGSPRREIPEPTKLQNTDIVKPVPRYEDFNPEKSPAVKRAEHLVQEVSNVRDQMQNVVSDVERWRLLDEKRKKDAEYEKAKNELLNGPSPLDPYLDFNKSSSEKFQAKKELASPYKSVPDLSSKNYNAPLLPGFSDAKQVLQEVKQNKDCLEANLEAVFRARQEAEVYTLMENLYQDSYNTDLTHIRKMVDKKVATLRSQVQREVTDEVVWAELNRQKVALPPKTTAASQPAQRGTVRGKPGAKIDTGLSKIKGPSFGPPPSKEVKGKENKVVVNKMPTKARQRSVFEDEEYMTRVYGKASYQNKRTTMKDPYLHYQNVPKVKPERPSPAPELKTGHLVKSARTQTGPSVKQFYFNPAHGTYIPVASASSAPIPGQLVPMAVPLGGPRMDGGLTAPVTLATPSGPLTSTPASRPQVTAAKNVTMVTVPVQDDLQSYPEPELSKQVLPNLDIDSEVSEVSPIPSRKAKPTTFSSRSKSPNRASAKSPSRASAKSPSRASARGNVQLRSPQESPSKNKYEVVYHTEREEKDSFTDVSDEDLNPEDAPGIALPGYQPPSPPPEEIPPPTLAQKMAERIPQPSSEVLAEDIRRRELVENNALEWIEQELMARIISEMYPLKREEEQPQLGHIVPDESIDSVSEDNEQSMFVMDSIGRTGLQMFVDAGQPVDTNLVNALIREVLEEKVRTILGQQPDQEVQGTAGALTTAKLTAAADPDRVVESQIITMQEYEPKHIQTPQPTPKTSPRRSPVRVISPPVTPPLSPRRIPQEQFQPIPEPAPVLQESEPEESESIDISEELRLLRGKILLRQSGSPPVQVHDIETPISTPVPEPEPEEPRPLTPPQETPRVQEPVVEALVVTKPIIIEPVAPVVEPTVEKEVKQDVVEERPSSPKPWGDPSSPRPEENPDYREGPDGDQQEQPMPFILSVAPTEEPPAAEQRPKSPKSPASPARKASPSPSETESITQSSISDSINQCISEGQWLLDKSDGEIADFPMDEVTRMRMTQKAKRVPVDISGASTLRGVEDMKDESVDFPISEGEFQYNPSVPPDKDPMLLLLAKLQHQPVRYVEQSLERQQGQFQMSSDQVSDLLNHTGDLSIGQLRGSVNQSMGEVRFVQPGRRGGGSSRKGRSSPHREYDYDRRAEERGYRARSPQYGRDSPARDRDHGRRSPQHGRDSPAIDRDHGRRSPHYGRDSPVRDRDYGRQSPDHRGRMTPERDYHQGRRSPQRSDQGRMSPQRPSDGGRSPQRSRDGGRSPQRSRDRDTASPHRGRQSPARSQRVSYDLESGSPIPEYEKYTIETTTKSSRKLRHSGEYQDPADVRHDKPKSRPAKPSTPGGVSLGGMGGTSPIKSALRKPPQVAKSQGMPEKSVTLSGTRTFHVRGSDEGQRSNDNNLSMSGTRTFTPDQMNMDELIQSGYLMQNLTQSSTLEKDSIRDTRESGRISNERLSQRGSLGLTYSFENGGDSYSESELKRLADTGSSRMSGTLPSTGGFYDDFR